MAKAMAKEVTAAIEQFKMMGYEILTVAEHTANGPDLHIMKNGAVFRVEVKKARAVKRSMAVHPVEDARKSDDIISVVFPSGYVFIEPMADYLRNCSQSGSRSFFGIY